MLEQIMPIKMEIILVIIMEIRTAKIKEPITVMVMDWIRGQTMVIKMGPIWELIMEITMV